MSGRRGMERSLPVLRATMALALGLLTGNCGDGASQPDARLDGARDGGHGDGQLDGGADRAADGRADGQGQVDGGGDGRPDGTSDVRADSLPDAVAHDGIYWQSLGGPPGGSSVVFAQDPYHPARLYTGTARGLYRSENQGESWTLVAATNTIFVSGIAFSRNRVFLCAGGAAYVYDYDGTTETVQKILAPCNAIFATADQVFVTSDFEQTADPQRPVRIQVAAADSTSFSFTEISPSAEVLRPLWEASGGKYLGVTRLVAIGGGELLACVAVADGPVTSGDSLAAYKGTGLYRTTDLGATWTQVSSGLGDKLAVHVIAQDAADPKHLLLGAKPTDGGRFRTVAELVRASHDGGQTWAAATSEASILAPFVNDVDIVGDSYYLTNVDTSLVRLLGPGHDETQRFPPPAVPGYTRGLLLEAMVFDAAAPGRVYGRAGEAVIRSDDGLASWKLITRGMVGSMVSNITLHPTDSQVIVTSNNQNYRPHITYNGGQDWLPLVGVSTFADEVAFDPHDPNHMLLIDELTILSESRDLGRTWTNIAPHFSGNRIYDFEVTPGPAPTMYVSNLGTGLSAFFEVDRFEEFLAKEGYAELAHHWKHLYASSDYAYDLELDPADPNTIYATYSPKIFEKFASLQRLTRSGEESMEVKELLRVDSAAGMSSIAVDERDPRTIYAGVLGEGGTIYVSRDRGATFGKLNPDLTFTTIWGHSQLQIAPDDANTVYAGTWGGGSFKTGDGGASWEMLDQSHTFSPTCLAIAKSNPMVVYACDRTAAKIHRSGDGGKTWTEHYDFGAGHMLSAAVAVDPDDADTIYASAFRPPMAHGGTLVRIVGASATPLGGDLPRSAINITIDPHSKQTLYVSTHIHGLYKSEDSGAHFTRLDDQGTGLPRIGYYDLEVDPEDSRVLYATALCGLVPDYLFPPGSQVQNLDPDGKCGLYKSEDGGRTWALGLETRSEARGIAFDDRDHHRLFVADMMGGIWVSNDAGATWKQENSGLGSRSMTSVKVKAGRIYASTQGSGVYAGVVGSDGTIAWDQSRSNKPRAFVAKIQVRVDPANSQRIYASAYPGGLLRSDDGGQTWNDKNFLTPSIRVVDPTLQGYYAFDIDRQSPSTIWLGTYGKGMFVSYDGMDYNTFANGSGDTMSGKHMTAVRIRPGLGSEVWAGGLEGVFVTRDGGKTWAAQNDGLDTLDVLSLKVLADGTVYAGTAGYGVYVLQPGKTQWTQMGRTTGLGSWAPWERRLYQYSALLFHRATAGKVYLGHFPGGFFVSQDGGQSWRSSSLGLGNDGMFSLAAHPTDPEILWAGTYNGVSRSEDGGQTWMMKSDGMPGEQWPFTVAIDSADPRLMYVATKNGANKGFCERNQFCGVVMKSSDGGESWQEAMSGLNRMSEFYSLVIHPVDHRMLVLSTSDGVFASLDAAQSWVPVNAGLPVTWNQVRDNVAQNLKLTADGRSLIFGLSHYGVFRSELPRARP